MLGSGNFRRAQPAGETLWKDRERGNASENDLWVYWLCGLSMSLQHVAGGMAGRYLQATGGAQPCWNSLPKASPEIPLR